MSDHTHADRNADEGPIPWYLGRGSVFAAAVLGLGLRLAHIWILYQRDPHLLDPMVDATGYHQWALRILEHPMGPSTFFQDPAYPYILASIYAVFGADPIAALAVQALAGAAVVLLVASATRLMLPAGLNHRAAVGAAWIMALYQPILFYDALLLKVQFTHLVAVLSLLLYLKGTSRPYPFRSRLLTLAAAGLATGVLVLLRGNFYLTVPFLALWLLIPGLLPRFKKLWQGSGSPEVQPMCRALAGTLSFCCGFFAVLSIVAAHNHAIDGRWAFTSGHAGSALYYGNNPYSPLGDFRPLPFVRANPQFEEGDFRAEARRRSGIQMDSREASSFWQNEALRYCWESPDQTLRRILHKVSLILESYEDGDNYSMKFYGRFSWLVRPIIPWWTLILAFSCALLLALPRVLPGVAPVLFFTVTYALSLVIFWVNSRYRIALVPFLAILAAAEVAWLLELIRVRSYRQIVAHSVIIVTIITSSLILGVPRQRGENLGVWYASLGAKHFEAKDYGPAFRLFHKGLALNPGNSLLWTNLGRFQLRLQKPQEAVRACGEASRLDAGAEPRECLALAYAQLGKIGAAIATLAPFIQRHMPLPRYLLWAMLHDRDADPSPAIQILQDGLKEYSEAPELHAHLARLLHAEDPRSSQEHYRRALALTRDKRRLPAIRSIAGKGSPSHPADAQSY